MSDDRRVTEMVEAARLVGRILRGGAYTNVVLEHAGPDPVGRRRALVYDVIRRLAAIDQAITAGAGRPLDRIDPDLADVLRVAVADLASGRPVPLVVDAGVRAAKRVAPRAGGFANAVLRRVSERGVPTGPDPELAHGIPGWLAERMERAWDAEEAEAFWEASDRPPRVGLRFRPGAEPPPGAEPVDGIPGAYLWSGGEIPPRCEVQDPASVAVGLVVGAGPGATVLEIGAAPGGKTLHLLDEVGEEGKVVATDAHPRRTRSAARRVPLARWVTADGRHPPFGHRSFPRILIDAPCSGLGALRRRPEIRLRITSEEVERLARLQRELVEAAIPLLAPGGRLVYSVCTVTPEETVEVVEGRGFHPPGGLPGRQWGDGWLLAPHLAPTDGMFVAVRER